MALTYVPMTSDLLQYPCKGSEEKLILNPFIIKNGEYDPEKLSIDKTFVQIWSSF